MTKMKKKFQSNLALYEPDPSTKIGVKTLRVDLHMPSFFSPLYSAQFLPIEPTSSVSISLMVTPGIVGMAAITAVARCWAP